MYSISYQASELQPLTVGLGFCVSLAVRYQLNFNQIWYCLESWNKLAYDESLGVRTKRFIEHTNDDRRSFGPGER